MTAETNLQGQPGRVVANAECPAPRRGPERGWGSRTAGPRQPRWRSRYTRSVVVSDILAVALSSALYAVWGSALAPEVAGVGSVIIALTGCALLIARAWDPSILGQGSLEFARLFRGVLGAAVVVGLVSLAIQMPQGRPWAFGVLPVAGLIAAGGRRVLRIGLHRRRLKGEAMARVLAVGNEESVASLIIRTRRAPHHGWVVAGVCTPTGSGSAEALTIEGIDVIGDLDSVARLATTGGFDTISVGQAAGWSPRRLQRLAWDLEGTRTELVVDPGLMEIAGPRLHVDNVDGLPLLRLTAPSFAGAPQLIKGVIDRVAASLILLMLMPLLLVITVAVKLDGGPVFFRQTRIGIGGREFRMIKFRSMVVDAEAVLAALTAANEAAGPLFKIRHDPRITAVGRVLRKFSLDELPQLLNVLSGTMSLVGPRPPLASEVAGYERDARRRLLVKPGMTGLWQISGRSDLSWEETVRLDLRYVENWTLALDAQIMLRTVRAVLKSDGAY